MALVVIVAFFVASFFPRPLSSEDVSSVSDALRGSIAKARLYSMTGKDGSSFGVIVQDGKIIFFRGESFALRDVSVDESFVIPSQISVSGMGEVAFEKATGKPDHTPTVVISGNGVTETWKLNAEGVME